jgi:hypothetical protein
MAVSFTWEPAAREGEPKEPPPELKVQLEETAALSVGEPEFFDLKRPPNFAPDGPERPGETPVRTAVGRHLFARRKPGVQIPSPPPPLMTSGNVGRAFGGVPFWPGGRVASIHPGSTGTRGRGRR